MSVSWRNLAQQKKAASFFSQIDFRSVRHHLGNKVLTLRIARMLERALNVRFLFAIWLILQQNRP